VTGRGGKGSELWKRGSIKKVILPEPVLPSLEVEDDAAKKAKK
jgi:hypothetical protein